MIKISKSPNSDFTVLNLTDTHLVNPDWGNPTVRRTFEETIRALIEGTKPDLSTVSGDISFAHHQASYTKFADLIDRYQIPWTVCWGNHDHQSGDAQLLEYEKEYLSYKNFVYETGNPAPGYGNFTIAICENDRIVHGIILIDCFFPDHPHLDPADPEKNNKIFLPELIAWYQEEVNSLLSNGCKESTVITHTPFYEYKLAFDAAFNAAFDCKKVAFDDSYDGKYWNEGFQGSFGLCCEYITYSDAACGLFPAMKALGSTRNVIVGHDHLNNFSIPYEGIRLTYGMASSSVGLKDVVGGTLITIDSSGSAAVTHVPVSFEISAKART